MIPVKRFALPTLSKEKCGAAHKVNSLEKCIFCRQCLVNCPFGAPKDVVDPVDLIISKLKDKSLTVVATTAPAVRVAIGEEFGMEPGSLVTENFMARTSKPV